MENLKPRCANQGTSKIFNDLCKIGCGFRKCQKAVDYSDYLVFFLFFQMAFGLICNCSDLTEFME